MSLTETTRSHTLKYGLLVISVPFFFLIFQALNPCGAPWMRVCRYDLKPFNVSVFVMAGLVWLLLLSLAFKQRLAKGFWLLFVTFGYTVILACLAAVFTFNNGFS